MSIVNTSVEDWLRSLGLLKYSVAFDENGYDDLDICKQIGDEDLDAIGVINANDRRDILHSVNLLKDKGVNAVYFQLEGDETANTTSFGRSDREKYRREDLINRMKELLSEDSCVLQDHNPNNDHDPLDALAQYYADQLYTYVQDVKEVLEYLRDGESNEGSNETSSPKLPPKKKHNLNSKLANENTRYLSKSLNSLDSSLVQGKTPKSPKHGLGRIFGSKKSKNYVQQPPPKICGPMETAILASQVTMSDDDRKSLMLQVKHGDITQDEAMSNFLSYEATHTPSKEQDKSSDKHSKKKRGGFFNRSSFKRHSSGHSSEVLASNIALGEKDRLELMRQVKTGEISREDAFERLSRIGSKRESKNNKSPKHQRVSKSPKSKDRISASSFQLHASTFYTGVTPDISQSTSNIPSSTNSTDSSPDSTPGFTRKFADLQLNQSNSAEQLGSSGSFESMDTKGNYSKPKSGPPVPPKRSPSPLTHSDLRRTVSAKGADAPREAEYKRRSTLSSVSDVQTNRCSCGKFPQNITNEKESTEMDHERPNLESAPPVPSRTPPKLPPNKPVLSQAQTTPTEPPRNQQNKSGSRNSPEAKKPKLPDKPALPTKPSLRPKPPVKPHRLNTLEKSAASEPGDKEMDKNGYKKEEKATLISLVNGVSENRYPSVTETSSKGEVTSEEKVEIRNPIVPPRRPSPFTRVSRHKPLGPKLLEMIEVKLKDEGIDLVQEPYTNIENGEWGVPMTLIDRYSCELDATMREVTKEIDHIRIEKLNHANRMATPCDLTHLRFAPDVIGKLSSMADWLTSLGLPMYIDNLMEAGYDDVHQIPYLSEEHLDFANITIPQHRHRLIRSLENMTPTYRQTSIDE